MGIGTEYIVYITTDNELFFAWPGRRVDRFVDGENARIIIVLLEPVVQQPREESALPSPATLISAIDGFLYAIDPRFTVLAHVRNLIAVAVDPRSVT